MDAPQLAKWWAAIAGVSLVAAGLLGFIANPIVGEAQHNPIFVTDAVHNLVHIVTGAIALYIALGTAGLMRANALIAFGVLYALVLVGAFISPDLFGLLGHPVNPADHALHLGLAAVSVGVGWLARSP